MRRGLILLLLLTVVAAYFLFQYVSEQYASTEWAGTWKNGKSVELVLTGMTNGSATFKNQMGCWSAKGTKGHVLLPDDQWFEIRMEKNQLVLQEPKGQRTVLTRDASASSVTTTPPMVGAFTTPPSNPSKSTEMPNQTQKECETTCSDYDGYQWKKIQGNSSLGTCKCQLA